MEKYFLLFLNFLKVAMKALFTLTVLGLSLTLASCASSSKVDDTPAPVILPCYVPDNLPNNAMGKLGIQIIQINQVQRIVIPTDKIFEPRTARIMEDAYPGLNQLALYLHKYVPTRMAVSGYTDDLGSGSEDIALSEQQARSLISYLWTRGIPHECLTPMGIGKNESGTVASNRGIQGAGANRRIEITFKAKSRYAPL